jgi:hypothetical protein
MSTQESLDAAIEAAARAWAEYVVLGEFGTDPDEDDRRNVAEATRHAAPGFQAAVRAAAPLIPVSAQQCADIERDALLRAADEIGQLIAGVRTRPRLWDDGYRHGITAAEQIVRARAASVGTEEGR